MVKRGVKKRRKTKRRVSKTQRDNKIKLVIKYSVALLLIFGVLAAFVLHSLTKTVLAAFVLSYIFYPLYAFVNSKIKKSTVSALLVTFFVLLLLTIPTLFVVNQLSNEVFTGYIIAKQYIDGDSKSISCEGSRLCELLPESFVDLSPRVRGILSDALGKGSAYVFNQLTNTLLSITAIVLNLFIIFFIMYYMFKDGHKLVNKVKNIFPISKSRQDSLVTQFNNVLSAVVFGTVVVAVIQSILAGIGYYLFGIPSPIMWALITGVVALVPFLGPVVVWLPASLLLMISGYSSGDGLVFLRGVGLFLYGMLLVSMVDNILKPKIIGSKANVHPALILLGVIGGINFFGIVGIIVGPVIMAMFSTALETYLKEKDFLRG
jgi:predicted PurR-regulated permease PerM